MLGLIVVRNYEDIGLDYLLTLLQLWSLLYFYPHTNKESRIKGKVWERVRELYKVTGPVKVRPGIRDWVTHTQICPLSTATLCSVSPWWLSSHWDTSPSFSDYFFWISAWMNEETKLTRAWSHDSKIPRILFLNLKLPVLAHFPPPRFYIINIWSYLHFYQLPMHLSILLFLSIYFIFWSISKVVANVNTLYH